jgi:hypothetical protein
MIKRINLLSGPRNISTALMYSFAQRTDTKVFDEPLYAYYLKNSNAKSFHPGAEEILKSLENKGEKVVQMMLSEESADVLFYKNMTHHLLKLDRSFLSKMINVFLTRHPKEMIASFAKVIPNPTIDDIGYARHTELLDYFETLNIKPIVIDSKRILLNPEKVLSQLCDLIGIPFDRKMLSWEAKPRSEDGVWAKYWYNSVHQSTKFSEYNPNINPFPEHLKPLLEECLPHYNRLIEYSIG